MNYKNLSYEQVMKVHMLNDRAQISSMNLLSDILIMHKFATDPDDINSTLINMGILFISYDPCVRRLVHEFIKEHSEFLQELREQDMEEAVRDDWTDWCIVLKELREDISKIYSETVLSRDVGVTHEEVALLYSN